jgi:hypothetical protein
MARVNVEAAEGLKAIVQAEDGGAEVGGLGGEVEVEEYQALIL